MIYSRILALLLILAPGGFAAEWQGFDSFFRVLEKNKIRCSRSLNSSLIFVIGIPPSNPRPSEFRRSVEKGSVLVIATESTKARPLLGKFELNIKENFVFQSPFFCFESQPDCPLIKDFNPSYKMKFFNNIKFLVTNRAKIITGKGITIASYPTLFGTAPAFAKIAHISRGTVIAIGDQSLFINLMLPEGGNKMFLKNILDFARSSRACVFIDGNIISSEKQRTRDNGKLPGIPNTLPDIRPTVEDVNNLIADIQRDFPLQKLGKKFLPVFFLLAIVAILLSFVHQILKIYLPSKNPFSKRKKIKKTDYSFTARNLVVLAPENRRKQIFHLARKARGKKRFLKFLKELGKTIKVDSHDN